MPAKAGRGGLVWSSDPEAMKPCPRCGQRPCVCRATPYPPPEKQTARLLRSIKGRAGKAVIVIEGLELPPEEYRELQRTLSRSLGTGGTVKDNVIEIQGDMRDRVADALGKLGYRIKLVGG